MQFEFSTDSDEVGPGYRGKGRIAKDGRGDETDGEDRGERGINETVEIQTGKWIINKSGEVDY